MSLDDFSNLTLLYVDDEDDIRVNAVEYFGRLFSRVFEARDGIEAFSVYTHTHPDIIITDIRMPRQNGLEFVKKIRKSDKKTPVIILTASADTDCLLEAISLQLVKYIVKPVSNEKLKSALNLACESLKLDNCNIKHLSDRLVYDTFNKTLFWDKDSIKLTKSELLLLDLLVRSHPRSVTYQEIENFIWTDDSMSIDALRTLVRSLRKKLQADIIENISGIGYKLTSVVAK